MTADGGAATGGMDELAEDDWQYVPPAMRPLRARLVLAALVLLFAGALVATLALPSYAATGFTGEPASPPQPAQHYQVPEYDAP